MASSQRPSSTLRRASGVSGHLPSGQAPARSCAFPVSRPRLSSRIPLRDSSPRCTPGPAAEPLKCPLASPSKDDDLVPPQTSPTANVHGVHRTESTRLPRTSSACAASLSRCQVLAPGPPRSSREHAAVRSICLARRTGSSAQRARRLDDDCWHLPPRWTSHLGNDDAVQPCLQPSRAIGTDDRTGPASASRARAPRPSQNPRPHPTCIAVSAAGTRTRS